MVAAEVRAGYCTGDVVTLALRSYGSLEFEKLALLDDELPNVAQSSKSRAIVLDLGHGRPLGAGFLSVLERLRAATAANSYWFVWIPAVLAGCLGIAYLLGRSVSR